MNLVVSMEMPPMTDKSAWYLLTLSGQLVVSLTFLRLQQELAFSVTSMNIPPSCRCGCCNCCVDQDHHLLRGYRGVCDDCGRDISTSFGCYSFIRWEKIRFGELQTLTASKAVAKALKWELS
ncbi:unnamed protein product [Peronospora farinosa]|uniref:Uncharacterized protein n=1 Tax=Peronospora farinosa TaxID=134698 RepID=A0AAV0V055_9STRA|nr:unnamed protein product [Peronospora farinosa]CAI5741300.1 unnamed protein product [Peronospora farinosa]